MKKQMISFANYLPTFSFPFSAKTIGVLLIGLLFFASCEDEGIAPLDEQDEVALTAESLQASLDSAEIAGLYFMREEEKLARDVYLTLYEKWNVAIFNNIAQSEQKHTDAVLGLIKNYGLTDPVVSDEIGIFAHADLQALYGQLVEEGSKSVVAALTVGATIEDLDIVDLQEEIAATHHEDIALIYGSLEKGSRNHLRSFYTNLLNQGSNYSPQFLTQEAFDAIVTSPMERGN